MIFTGHLGSNFLYLRVSFAFIPLELKLWSHYILRHEGLFKILPSATAMLNSLSGSLTIFIFQEPSELVSSIGISEVASSLSLLLFLTAEILPIYLKRLSEGLLISIILFIHVIPIIMQCSARKNPGLWIL